MFTKEKARLFCFFCVIFGSYYMLNSRPNDGPFTTAYRLALVTGGWGGLIFLWWSSRNKKQEASAQESEMDKAAHPAVAHAQPTRPEWMGDPKGKRRRLFIIMIALAVLGAGFTIFVLTQHRE